MNAQKRIYREVLQSTTLKLMTPRPGKGVDVVAAKNESGKWRVGLMNLYASARDVEVFFPANSLPGSLEWNYYDATMPQHALQGSSQKILDHSLILRLPPRSLSFLRDQSVS